MSCDQDKMGTDLRFFVDARRSRRSCRLLPLASAAAIVAAFSTAAFSRLLFFLPLSLSLPPLSLLLSSSPLLPHRCRCCHHCRCCCHYRCQNRCCRHCRLCRRHRRRFFSLQLLVDCVFFAAVAVAAATVAVAVFVAAVTIATVTVAIAIAVATAIVVTPTNVNTVATPAATTSAASCCGGVGERLL
jgi:hypothetical protein